MSTISEKKGNDKKELIYRVFSIILSYLTIQIIRTKPMELLMGSFRSDGIDILKDVAMRSKAVELLDSLLPYSFTGTFELIAIILAFSIYWKSEWRPTVYSRWFLRVFSVFFFLGYTIDHIGSLPFLSFCAVIMVILYFGVYYICCCLLFYFKKLWEWYEHYVETGHIKIPKFDNVIKNAVPIFLIQLPLIIIRYPAGIDADGYSQINQFLEHRITAHWPPAVSVYMGLFALGSKKIFGEYEVGIFLYVIAQSIITALIIGYGIKILGLLKASDTVKLAVYAGYMFSPFVLSYTTQITKDSIYAYIMLLFIILMTEELLGINRKTYHRILVLIVSFLVCISRNNGIYAIAGMAMMMLVIMLFDRDKKKWLYPSLCIITSCVLFVLYNSVLLISLQIPKGLGGEAFSIPFQQTARYVKTYPDEVTEEDREVINALLNYDELADKYNPFLSDPVKNPYHGNKEDLLPYFRVWLKHFSKHPLVYFEATLCNAIGFYYTDAKLDNGGAVGFSRDMAQESGGIALRESTGILRMARIAAVALFKSVGNIPFVWFLCSTAVYIWLSLYLFLREILRRNYEKAALFMPSVVGTAVCIASPTFIRNGERYALPIIYASFFLIGVCCCRNCKEKVSEPLEKPDEFCDGKR